MSEKAIGGPLAEYARLIANTRAYSRGHPGVGEAVGIPAGRGALGITVGCWLPRSDAVLAVHDQLAALAAADEQLELVPRTCPHLNSSQKCGLHLSGTPETLAKKGGQHFVDQFCTFLALHWDLYEGWPATPKQLRQILPFWTST